MLPCVRSLLSIRVTILKSRSVKDAGCESHTPCRTIHFNNCYLGFAMQELKQKLERLRQKHGAGVMENQGYFNDDLLSIRTGLVTLHGELVLMESYSSLNYTG